MTQQPWDTVAPSAPPTVYSRPFRVMIVAFLAIFAFGIGNTIYSVRHRPAQVTASNLTQGRLTQVHTTMAQPQAVSARPTFDENRDGSGSLDLEDLNGTATVWDDEKSGSRIFCHDSCIVLPAPHRHHRRK